MQRKQQSTPQNLKVGTVITDFNGEQHTSATAVFGKFSRYYSIWTCEFRHLIFKKIFHLEIHNQPKSVSFLSQMKYADTTLNSIYTKLSTFTPTELSVTNVIQSNSVWGFLSVAIYGSNTVQDRRFISTLWSIGNQVLKQLLITKCDYRV